MDPISPIENVQETPNSTTVSAPETEKRAQKPDRRKGDRRILSAEESGYDGPERRQSVIDRRTGLERRRGPGIRREEDRRHAEEGEFSDEQLEFVMAIETYKKVNKRMFPTWTEVLEVIRQLGYRKIQARTINLNNVPEPELHKKSA